MSGNRAIDPLPLDQFPQESDTQDPGFEELFSQLVADAGTPADGFEDDVAIANSLLDSLDGALSALGSQGSGFFPQQFFIGLFRPPLPPPVQPGNLDDTFADILAVDPAPAGADVVNISAALPDFQANVDNLGALLAGPPLPGPVPGGGGSRPATCGSLDMGSHPFQVSGNVNNVTVTVQLTNNLTQPLTVKGVTWTPPQTFGFVVSPSIDGRIIQPGAALSINIVAASGGVGTTSATLTVQTDGPDPQPCLNVQAEWVAGTLGGRGPVCTRCSDWGCPQ